MRKRLKTVQKKRKRMIVIVNAVLLVLLLMAFGREYVGNLQVEREILMLEQQKAALEQEQLETAALIEQLSSEYYLEQEARTKHGMAKDGETVLIVTDEDQTSFYREGVVIPELVEEVTVSHPVRWMYYFFAPDRLSQL
jgi:cell division protein FtsB